jgi:pimeloyl-ACP methyl ester carboxylesterase
MSPVPVYCISGLGADARVFEHLSLPGYTLIHLPWITPLRGEALGAYAARMAAPIKHPSPVVMGLSFGGVMAIEIARLLPVRRLWLLSTVKQRSEMPGYMRFGKYLPLHKLFLPLNPQRWLGPLENRNLGVETPEERAMVADYRKSVDVHYLRWAIDALINWDMPSAPGNTLHIHGGADRIFPVALARPDFVVAGAGHFMVHNRAPEVSRLLLADL